MSLTVLEKALLAQTQELPEEAVQQLVDFAQFLGQKQSHSVESSSTSELTVLAADQVKHLEEEFENYRQRYPREDE